MRALFREPELLIAVERRAVCDPSGVRITGRVRILNLAGLPLGGAVTRATRETSMCYWRATKPIGPTALGICCLLSSALYEGRKRRLVNSVDGGARTNGRVGTRTSALDLLHGCFRRSP